MRVRLSALLRYAGTCDPSRNAALVADDILKHGLAKTLTAAVRLEYGTCWTCIRCGVSETEGDTPLLLNVRGVRYETRCGLRGANLVCTKLERRSHHAAAEAH